MLTRESVLADIAGALGRDPSSVSEEMDVLDQGLDSVRIMGLIEKWRHAGATEVDLPTLAEDPTVGHWVSLVARG